MTIGIIPSESPDKLRLEYSSIKDYLEKEMGRPIEVYIPENYKDLIKGMKDERVDIGLFGPFSYIIADSQQNLTPLIVSKRKDSGITYNSLIISGKDSGISNIDDLKDRSITFVNSASTSGYIIPQSLFLSRNINIDEYFSTSGFSGTHDQVIRDVINKKSDAGAVSNAVLSRLISQGILNPGDLKIVWKSEAIPDGPYSARESLSRRVTRSFTEAMLNIHINAPEALKEFDSSIEQYLPVEERLYNPIRNIINILGNDFIDKNYL